MSAEIRNLEPKALWNNFADLNAVPRPSKKEERVIQFMVDFGNKLGFETVVDPVGNVIIKKPATEGMENRKTIVMQSHLDMVHQKNADTDFDFDTEGIKMYVENGWVTAEGTTLGADNGLGVAAIMSVLESTDIAHPAIEALFTIDEETGMTGAMGLEAGYLTGEILLNLDTEEDDEIDMGCAGGVDITATKSYTEESANGTTFDIAVRGLNGGHSGMDIIKELGNANKIMNRILYATMDVMQVSEINGGSLRNAIPRESFAKVVVSDKETFLANATEIANTIKVEFATLEENLEITFEEVEAAEKVMTKEAKKLLILAIYGAHNGVYRMSPDMEDLVETSNNIARVIVKDGSIKIGCLTRSSVESTKMDLAYDLRAVFELAKFEVEFSGSYPGWKPNVNSPILKVMTGLYEELFDSKPNVVACHAGLECGILGTNYPEMDMISFGPNIRGAHSPDERAEVKSAQKFWKFLLEILKNIPAKA
ncbi:aminoacyl-histidine dipeptidase [Aureivirga sp. CE67]|uniref:aminoacyl-histidine dipeptidase n=1 Tax=Aureivirga sp. CE67 TaxID=1788983 RepID=UPI0018CA9D8D|nr:aminoacyl-histidine dipeptidase [Aureivirga sp. CE67]